MGWIDDAEEEDLPQWLRDLAGEEAVEEEEEPLGSGELLGEPDLLGRLGGLYADEESPTPSPMEETPPEEAAEPLEETLDWLRDLGEDAEERPEASTSGEAAPEAEGLPDWLGDLTAEPEVPEGLAASVEAASSEAEEEWSDWGSGPASPAEAAPPSVQGEEEGLPDWLSDLEEPSPAAQDAPAGGEDLPDWLSDLGESSPAAQDAPAGEEDLPDWLRDLEETPEEPGKPSATPPLPAEEESWPGQAREEEALPDWLLQEEEAAPPTATEPTPSGESEPVPDWLAEVEQEKDLPDWLAEVEQEPGGEAPGLPAVNPFDVAAPVSDEAAFLALEAEEGAAGEATVEEAALPAVPGTGEEDLVLDVPDWLDDLAPEALAGPEEVASPGEEEGMGELAPGKLPDWLEAIRPDDVALPGLPLEVAEEEPEVAETQGPLAGLSGVLPAKTFPRPRKTGGAAARLSLREEEARYAEILQEVVAEEKQVTPPPRRWRWAPQRVLRVALALVLLLVVWLPSMFGGLVPPLPEGIPPEVMAANRIVSQLPDQPRVLLAVDYNPAWRAEMESAAAPLVDHLMVRGARIAVMSTQPMGPALAEHFLHGPLAEHGYVEGQQYVNLGYLSGGVAALQHLALSPVAAAPYAAWQAAPLSGIRQINDFDLVVVMSDDPDVARAWVEQVQPHLSTTPLILVVSAQAEPLVRPYYESRPQQVQGLVTGLLGGLAYTRLTGRLSEGLRYWGGFTWGIWAAILMLVLGGMYNLILGWRARRQAHG